MKWLSKLGNLFDGDLFEGVRKVIDESFTSEEEKNDFVLELEKQKLLGKKIDVEFVKALVLDNDSARKATVALQTNVNVPKMAKVVPYVLDILIVLGFFAVLVLMMFIIIPTSNIQIVNILIGVLGTLSVNIIGFHRGSSSKIKV